jgi:hypothetical protein
VKQSALIIGITVLAVATLLGGAIQGKMSRRWGRPQELSRLAERLRQLPTEIGDWKTRSSSSLSPTAEAILECAGYVSRQYENRRTGEIVNVAVLLGPAGPISVHTPDVCYSSQDYSIIDPPKRTRLDAGEGSRDELWATSLQSTKLTAGDLRVYYGWSTGGPWSAPRKDPRMAFAGQPYLYKVQVAGPLPSAVDANASDPSVAFLKDFLPAVRPYLVEHAQE